MKKTISILLLLASVMLFASCVKTPAETTPAPTQVQTPTQTNTPTPVVTPTVLPTPTDTAAEKAIESVECTRDGDNAVIKVTAKGITSAELGVIVLTDEKYTDNWRENPEAVIDIAQIFVDENGSGSVTVTVPSEIAEFTVCVSSEAGSYIYKAGGKS